MKTDKPLDQFHFHPGWTALLEIAVMFLPAIPAYLWLWPTVEGTRAWIAQSLVYVYVLAGTLFIGLRRWSLSELGLNFNGLGLSLACGLVFLGGRLLVILSIDWGAPAPQFNLVSLVGRVLFYFGLVGLVEELLYRGLVYRALDDWLGVRWAIWGSSIGFVLWHIFGQGPLIGMAALFIGLVFALFRWRTGGILGLILVHGLWDLQAVLLVSEANAEILSRGRPEISYPALMGLGLALMLLPPLYLGMIHPFAGRFFHKTG